MFKTLAAILCVCFSVFATPFIHVAHCQTVERSQTNATNTGAQKVEDDVKQLKDDLKEVKLYGYTGLAALALFASLVSIYSLFSYLRGRQVERSNAEMLTLLNTTLRLVNESLRQSVDATRAVRETRATRVQKKLEALNEQATQLLLPFVGRDNRDLVGKPKNLEKLKKAIDMLRDFDRYNAGLDAELILPQHAKFIRAMQYYLDQNFDEAIDNLKEIVANDKNISDLRIRSWFWMAYEQNNLMTEDGLPLEDAEASFNSAADLAVGERRILLEINACEAKMFQLCSRRAKGDSSVSVSQLLAKIERMAVSCETQGYETARIAARLIQGNFLHAAAMQCISNRQPLEAAEFVTKARNVWKPLAAIGHPMAVRDYAFSCIMLNSDGDKAAQADAKAAVGQLDVIRRQARTEARDRLEPRNKVSANAIILICFKELQMIDRIPAVVGRNVSDMAQVNQRVLLYSPLRKRNVTRDEMTREFEYIHEHGLPRVNLTAPNGRAQPTPPL